MRLKGKGGQRQDQDGDLSVGIPITSSTGRFKLLHNREDGEDDNLGTFTGVSRIPSFAQKRRGRLVKALI